MMNPVDKEFINKNDSVGDEENNLMKTRSEPKTRMTTNNDNQDDHQMISKSLTTTSTEQQKQHRRYRPIKWSQFIKSADTLIRISKRISIEDRRSGEQNNDIDSETQWIKKSLVNNSNKDNGNDNETPTFFLSKMIFRWIAEGQSLLNSSTSSSLSASTSSRKLYKFEYHIVYSVNYQTPVLYFYICSIPDGTPVSLDWLYDHLPNFHPNSNPLGSKTIKEIYSVFGNIITQTNHPILRIVVFMVHPCKTAELMGNVLSCEHCLSQDNDDNDNLENSEEKAIKTTGNESSEECTYLITWLSSLACYIGLPMSINYGRLDLMK